MQPLAEGPPDPYSLNRHSVKMLTKCNVNDVTNWQHGTASWAETYW